MGSALKRVQFPSTVKATTQKSGALSRRPCQEECTHCHKVQTPADLKQVQAIASGVAAGWDPATLRMYKLNHQDIGPILEDADNWQRSEWKDIADRLPTYNSY
jgi:hypothetical protein